MQRVKNLKKTVSVLLHKPYTGGGLLLFGAILALLMKNSVFQASYESFLNTPLPLKIASLNLEKTLVLWTNDGLMAIFFLLVGLEIKREFMQGELASIKKASLSFIAAMGGLFVPIFIYMGMTAATPEFQHGWAIPAATDIAFAVALLAIFGSHLPKSLKVSLLAIAIIDDIAAVLIIAFYYTQTLTWSYLFYSLPLLALLGFLNYRGCSRLGLYGVLGGLLWLLVLKSGVHATLAGIMLAFFIPVHDTAGSSLIQKLEALIHPWVIVLILPLFSFMNAGVAFDSFSYQSLLHPVALAITLGLFLGKQAGIMLFVRLGVSLRLCQLPARVTWGHFYGVALITGVGFTMSLFISNLAFEESHLQSFARAGILLGSALSAVLGSFVLYRQK